MKINIFIHAWSYALPSRDFEICFMKEKAKCAWNVTPSFVSIFLLRYWQDCIWNYVDTLCAWKFPKAVFMKRRRYNGGGTILSHLFLWLPIWWFFFFSWKSFKKILERVTVILSNAKNNSLLKIIITIVFEFYIYIYTYIYIYIYIYYKQK